LRGSRELGPAALPSLLVLGVSEDFVDRSLVFRSIEFQIIHDQIALAAPLEEDEWIGREEASRPKHVRVSLACAVDEARVRQSGFQHVILIEMSKTAGIIVIGNEILSGKTRDENSLYLARELRDLGVDVRKISVIPDELLLIADEVRSFSNSYDYVFTTGGVGPTHDDLTMEGIANAFGRHIHRNAEIEASIRRFYSGELIEGNLRMADVPEGARLVGGKGMWFPVVAVENVYVFPGVPEILRRKFERIKEIFREAPFYLREIYLKADEGQIAATLHGALQEFPELLLGSYPYFDNPVYSIKLTLESKDLSYLESAHASILSELARINLYPLNVGSSTT
jgi:molybdenum cofactor synthesis domain-containing protein